MGGASPASPTGLRDEWLTALDLADELKATRAAGKEAPLFPGRTLGMIFQKPSTRTRVSFEVGITQLGGTGLYLAASDLQLGTRRDDQGTAVVLSRYLDAIMIRTFAQEDVEELARHACDACDQRAHRRGAPVPGTRRRHDDSRAAGPVEGVRLAYVGDGTTYAGRSRRPHALLGLSFVAASPLGYEPPLDWVEVTNDPREAANGADVLYTDVWTSMGQDEERAQRLADFGGFTIDAELVVARRGVGFGAPLPARGLREEIPRTSSTAPGQPSGTRPRTACTRRRRCWR